MGRDSSSFVAYNGVNQGGVLSPVLFCIYIDRLLIQLAHAGVGCYIGSHFVGALAYADDIVLVAPKPSDLRKFAAANNMCFNAAKSKCIVIPPIRARHRVVYRLGSDCDPAFSINARKFDFVESYKHIGHGINSAFDDREDIADTRGAFVGQGNNVICYFNKLDPHIRQQLFDAYCTIFLAVSFGDLITARSTRFVLLGVALPDIYGFSLLRRIVLYTFNKQISASTRKKICKRFLSLLSRCLTHHFTVVNSQQYC
jgi:hypothetical protein